MPMTWVEAIVLGIVQGLTEFLPVSSSGHLRITSAIFFDRDAGASFTAVTQLGTEAAVLIYFAKDIWRITRTWVVGLRDRSVRSTLDYRMAWYVIIGSIPIGLLGYLFKDEIRSAARNLYLISTTLIVFALILAFAEFWGRVVTAGLLLNLTRETATRYSFLLAIPAVVMSGLFSIPDVFDTSGEGLTPSVAQMVVATVIAFVLGYASIAWLL